MSLLFSRGLASPQSLPGPVAPGATTFPLPDAATHFSPADPLFIAEADFSSPEYLGAVVTADATTLTSSLPALAARPAGAVLVKPLSSLRLPARIELPLRRAIDTGLHTQRTLGGQVVAIRTAATATRLTLNLTALTPIEEQRLLDWLAAETDHGRLPFNLIADARRLLALHLDASPFDRAESAGARRAITLRAFDLGARLIQDSEP